MKPPIEEDPYLWMEEVEGTRALDWVRAENARSLAVLEADRRYAVLRDEALAIATSQDRLPVGAVRDGYLYNFWQDAEHVRGIWRRSPLADYAANAPRWETLLDIDALATHESANWVFKGVACRPDGARCLVELSDGGKDAVILREFDVPSKSFVEGGFAIPEAKSSAEWLDNDTIALATNWGEGSLTESGYPAIVKTLRRGESLSAAREILSVPREEMGLFVGGFDDVDGTRTVIAHEGVTFFESVQWRIGANGAAQRLSLPRKSNIQAIHKGYLIVTLEEAWGNFPLGALIAVKGDTAESETPDAALLYAPTARESIESVTATRDAVLVAGYENVRGRILRFTFDGSAWAEGAIALPPNGAVGFAGASPKESTAFAVFENYTTPSTLYALDVNGGSARPIRSLPSQFDDARFVSEQFEAISRDGTRVPYFVVRSRDAQMNGENPTLLYGYGGFQISMTPAYAPFVGKMWLERGGVYVVANIRGGGEFGPAWHQSGLKTHRQVVYDDFIAVAEDLIARRITSPRRLGIQGGSNGGLLMGVMLTQRPELFHAAVVQVPLLDMLRYDRLLAGASWVDEYGSPEIPEERRWLEHLSPYHNLHRRGDMPTPFFVTSTKDDRVHPAHARKFAARMQELGMPFYYYENIDGGHAASANQNEVARRRALEFVYLSKQLMD
ncbi:MAG: prolyl oligopeptidase family serine peptidase [Caulobacterales bacterium]